MIKSVGRPTSIGSPVETGQIPIGASALSCVLRTVICDVILNRWERTKRFSHDDLGRMVEEMTVQD